jgi:hypothetical protein
MTDDNFQLFYQRADQKTFRMSIYMLNKIRTEPEIYEPKFDPCAAKKG